VRGWNRKADVGLLPLGQGMYYLAVNERTPEGQAADLTLMRWTGDAGAPFAPYEAARQRR
jgi:hypothetical protein